MMPIVSVFFAVAWLHHGRQPARVAPESTIVAAARAGRARLVLHVEGSAGARVPVIAGMLNEAAAIWQPLGLDLQRDRPDEPATPRLRVVVTDDPVPDGEGVERLGWIRFVAERPEPIVYLSRAAALRLLDSTDTLRREPVGYHDVLLARVLGRCLAHEIGHYVLASRTHAPSGLMRSAWPLDELVASDRRGFGVGRSPAVGSVAAAAAPGSSPPPLS